MLLTIRRAVLDALALLLPVACAGCGADGRGLCETCAAALAPQVTPRTLPDGTPAFTALRYEGVVRRVILSFKEQHRTDAAGPLAAALSAVLASAIARADTDARADTAARAAASAPTMPGVELAAVPPSRAAWRRRGYDPVAVLLRRAGYRASPLLLPAHRTARQKTLTVAERQANRQHSMRATGSLEGHRVLLVDDVLTSGATLIEAARAVRAAGGIVVGAAAVAYTPRFSSPSELTHSRR
ncbi:phosphoribosyltransferase family protein [Salinibacterium sp. ZJ454]|uniref:ComF family protein n=1 Tax=Salinibacterium sp. ZJ454 TaxID=2708339 RepID=UPI00141E3014|nr:phosphoribosyltransferase family protein [Salinibacterium sp. ZJ454]